MSEIIGAGLCRTGTSSTLVALEKLGLGPVYHMKEVVTQNLLWHWIAFFVFARINHMTRIQDAYNVYGRKKGQEMQLKSNITA